MTNTDRQRAIAIIIPAPRSVIAKFHYTGPTGPERTGTDFVGDPHGPTEFLGDPGPVGPV